MTSSSEFAKQSPAATIEPKRERPAVADLRVPPNRVAIDVDIESISYDDDVTHAVRNVAFPIARGLVTAFIGPSGCGKSTVLRSINRMNDQIRGFRLRGSISLDGRDVYEPTVDPVLVRRRIGMVFQQPNPFATTIWKNVAFGLRLNRFKGDMAAQVEKALRAAALWDEVKDRLHASALGLSGGQQQRLCIARAIATEPEVLLFDEPTSALDPIATQKVEELIGELRGRYTIAIVTHNMQQAQRLADHTAFLFVERRDPGHHYGHLVEFGTTDQVFNQPRAEETRQYVAGEFS